MSVPKVQSQERTAHRVQDVALGFQLNESIWQSSDKHCAVGFSHARPKWNHLPGALAMIKGAYTEGKPRDCVC